MKNENKLHINIRIDVLVRQMELLMNSVSDRSPDQKKLLLINLKHAPIQVYYTFLYHELLCLEMSHAYIIYVPKIVILFHIQGLPPV